MLALAFPDRVARNRGNGSFVLANGRGAAVDPAWRIAFRKHRRSLTRTQLIYLGINAHVNNDLAFMIEQMGTRYTYPDHKHVVAAAAV